MWSFIKALVFTGNHARPLPVVEPAHPFLSFGVPMNDVYTLDDPPTLGSDEHGRCWLRLIPFRLDANHKALRAEDMPDCARLFVHAYDISAVERRHPLPGTEGPGDSLQLLLTNGKSLFLRVQESELWRLILATAESYRPQIPEAPSRTNSTRKTILAERVTWAGPDKAPVVGYRPLLLCRDQVHNVHSLVTGPDGRTEIYFKDGKTVEVRERLPLVLLTLADALDPAVYEHQAGSVLARVDSLGASDPPADPTL